METKSCNLQPTKQQTKYIRWRKGSCKFVVEKRELFKKKIKIPVWQKTKEKFILQYSLIIIKFCPRLKTGY